MFTREPKGNTTTIFKRKSRLKNDWSDEETDNPLRADDRNFYKVEKWSKDGTKIDRMRYAGNNLEKARKLFADAISIARVSD